AGLFSVTGSVVKDVSIWWIASEQTGTGERPEKQHLALESIGQRYCRCGRANISDHCKNLVFLIEPLHCFGGSSRLVTVVRRYKPKHPAVHPTAGISHVERSLNANPHILAKFFSGTTEWGGNSKPNFVVGHTPERCPRDR